MIPISPNSFYGYLQVVVRGLRGMKIEEEKFKDNFDTLGTHITNARNKYDEVSCKLNRFEDKLLEVGDIDETLMIYK